MDSDQDPTESIVSPTLDAVVATAEAWPDWTIWTLWIVVTAALVMGGTEWPKRLFFKPLKPWRDAKRNRDKVMLLAPLLAALGAVIGGPVFLAAGMLSDPVLAVALGAGVGVMSSPIYDATIGIIVAIPRFVKKRAGLDTTATIPPVTLPAVPTIPSDDDYDADAPGLDGPAD